MGDFQPLILTMRRCRKVSIVVGVETKDAGMVFNFRQGNFLIDKVINFCGNFKAKLAAFTSSECPTLVANNHSATVMSASLASECNEVKEYGLTSCCRIYALTLV
jgi:hypothetical protein